MAEAIGPIIANGLGVIPFAMILAFVQQELGLRAPWEDFLEKCETTVMRGCGNALCKVRNIRRR